MEINNKKYHLSHIIVFFIMLLFAMCLTMNVYFGSIYNLCGLIDKATVSERWTISESFIANEDNNNTIHVKASYLNKTDSCNETITKNISSVLMTVDIPKGFSLFFLIIMYLFFFFILLPYGRTLVNQKVRLNN